MTRQEQYNFVRELIGNTEAKILARLDRVPEEWDGHELRQYVADQFRESVSRTMTEPRSRRMRDYRNTVLVNNLS